MAYISKKDIWLLIKGCQKCTQTLMCKVQHKRLVQLDISLHLMLSINNLAESVIQEIK